MICRCYPVDGLVGSYSAFVIVITCGGLSLRESGKLSAVLALLPVCLSFLSKADRKYNMLLAEFLFVLRKVDLNIFDRVEKIVCSLDFLVHFAF